MRARAVHDLFVSGRERLVERFEEPVVLVASAKRDAQMAGAAQIGPAPHHHAALAEAAHDLRLVAVTE